MMIMMVHEPFKVLSPSKKTHPMCCSWYWCSFCSSGFQSFPFPQRISAWWSRCGARCAQTLAVVDVAVKCCEFTFSWLDSNIASDDQPATSVEVELILFPVKTNIVSMADVFSRLAMQHSADWDICFIDAFLGRPTCAWAGLAAMNPIQLRHLHRLHRCYRCLLDPVNIASYHIVGSIGSFWVLPVRIILPPCGLPALLPFSRVQEHCGAAFL